MFFKIFMHPKMRKRDPFTSTLKYTPLCVNLSHKIPINLTQVFGCKVTKMWESIQITVLKILGELDV